MRRVLGFLGLAALAAATYAVTNTLIARPQGAPVRVPVQVLSAPTIEVLEVEPIPGGVDVYAVADVYHARRSRDLTWRLTVFEHTDEGWSILWEQTYDHQRLRAAAGKRAVFEFDEELALPPGTYSVQVGVNELKLDRLGRTLGAGRPIVSVPTTVEVF